MISITAVIIFDADNTLWDTNAVFVAAQTALLRTLQREGLLDDPAHQLPALRRLDNALVTRLGSAEYDFRTLTMAMALKFRHGVAEDEAIERVIAGEERNGSVRAIAERAHAALIAGLEKLPVLLPYAAETLAVIRRARGPDCRLVTLVFSEGHEPRLRRAIEAHTTALDGLVDDYVIAPKSAQSFAATRDRGLRLLGEVRDPKSILSVMVGDSLKRDIKFANQAGFVTVYVPAAYKGHETPSEPDEQPYATIADLRQLPAVLRDLGIPVEVTHS
jgi:putative hydrolase of the HAD superfamily